MKLKLKPAVIQKKKKQSRNRRRRMRLLRRSYQSVLRQQSLPEIFKFGDDDLDQDYLRYRNSSDPAAISFRRLCAYMWRRFKPYADNDFLKKFREGEIYSRFWEMDLACMLLDRGYSLEPANIKSKKYGGPDLCVLVGSKRVWFEAVTPSSGESGRKVPTLDSSPHKYPDEEIILRLTGSMMNKIEAYNRYIKNGVLKSDEPYIVSLNNLKMQTTTLDIDPPLIVRATLGVAYHRITKSANKAPNISLTYKPTIKSAKNNDVSTDLFADPAYAGISAVLFSFTDMVNRNRIPEVVLVFNHNATNQVDRSLFPFGRHYWMDNDGNLKRCNHS